MHKKLNLFFTLVLLSITFIVTCTAGCDDKGKKERENLNAEIEKKNAEIRRISTERDKLRRDNKILSIAIYSSTGIAVVIFAGIVLVTLNSPKKKQPAFIDNTHCPRCGWKHATGESICKNCKTHF